MPETADLGDVQFMFEAQSAVDTPASGAGAYGLEVIPSQGLQAKAATIVSRMIKRNKMKRRARRGSTKTNGAWETELIPDCFRGLGPLILGAAAWTPKATYDNTDFTTVVVDATAGTVTFGGGDPYGEEITAGMFFRFTNISVPGNNGKWVPIDHMSGTNGRIWHFPTTHPYLVDNGSDAAFTVEIAEHVKTPTIYQKTYATIEEYLGTAIDRSKMIVNGRFNSLVFNESATEFPRFSFSAGGRRMQMPLSGAAPNFSAATFPTGKSLILLDGGVFLNGVKRLDLTTFTYGITAPLNFTDLIGTTDGPSSKIGDFEFAGSITGLTADGDAFDDFDNDAPISLLSHYKDQLTEDGIGIYAGNLSFGGWGTPAGGEGDLLQTMDLYGGDDDRGQGYTQTTFLISHLDG